VEFSPTGLWCWWKKPHCADSPLVGEVCPDEPSPAEPVFPFITDEDTRLGVEDRLRAAWIEFKATEWLGATTFAAVVVRECET
jgi:hypothetical protein